MDYLLAVRGLRTEFATTRGVVRAVDGIDFEIGQGEVLGLVGESGCGKTVTALSIMYLIPQPPGRIAGGEIWFNGIDLLAGGEEEVLIKVRRRGRTKVVRNDALLKAHRARMNQIRGRSISMIFQEPMSSLNPVLPVGYQVAEVLLYQRRREICDRLLSRRGLSPEDSAAFERIVWTADTTEREHLLADFCMRTGMPPEKVVAIAEASGMSLEKRLDWLQRLETRRRRGNRWFLALLKRLDTLEEERFDSEWRRLSVLSVARRAAQLFDASRNPEARGLHPLSSVSLDGDSVRLTFKGPAPTEADRSSVEALIKAQAGRPDMIVFARAKQVTLGNGYIELDFGGEAESWYRRAAAYRSRRLAHRIVTGLPVIRKRLMRPVEEEARRHVLELLKLVRISEPSKVYHEYPHELSGGMQQRVMIAMALACRPALMIADEPTTALDVTTQAQILNLIKDLRQQIGSAILYITHDLAVIAELCDRVAVMYAGKIVESAPVADLYAQPLHPYTQGLLASIVSIEKKVKPGADLPTIPGTVPDLMNPPPACRFHPRCPFAFDRCGREEPKLLDRGGLHGVACHLYDEEGPKDAP